jgi:hypothetical protein
MVSRPQEAIKASVGAQENMKRVLFNDDFFIPIPGEIFNEFETGQMDLHMWGVYAVLLRQVDFETGVWRGTAYKISVAWNDHLELRTVQRALTRLDNVYVKAFRNPKGQRGGYYILLHNYRIRFGPFAGHYLDALASPDPKHPVYRRGTTKESDDHSDRDGTPSRHRHHRVWGDDSSRLFHTPPDVPYLAERSPDARLRSID